MPQPPTPEHVLKRAVETVHEALRQGYKPPYVHLRNGEKQALSVAAIALNVPRQTFQGWILQAERRGIKVDWQLYHSLEPEANEIPVNDFRKREQAKKGELGFAPVLPGFVATQITTSTKTGDAWIQQKPDAGEVFEPPSGHKVTHGTVYVNAEGRKKGEWLRFREEDADPETMVREFEDAFRDFKPSAKPKPAPRVDYKDQITVLPWSDPHFGLMCWRKEAREDWDLKTAVQTYQRVFSNIVERTPRTHKAILVVGGDTLHADTNEHVTPRSRHPLQVDGRHQKVFLSAGETIVEIAGWLLDHHAEVEIIVIAGNHDPTSAFPLACFLSAWFRNEPRMTVDLSPNIHRFRQFGRVGLGFTHGHTIKKSQLHTLFAEASPKIWGASDYRHFHTFHVHHDSTQDKGGCKVESHGVLIPPDAFAWGAGYAAAQRHQKSIVYHAERGWRETIVEAV